MHFYLCPACGNVYDGDFLNIEDRFEGGYCPIASCGCRVFEIDEDMIEPITNLNQKGYATEFCCTGHLYDGSLGAYIKFKHRLCTPKTVPKGWYADADDNYTCIRADIKGKTFDQRRKCIFRNMTNLIEWSRELPEYDPLNDPANEEQIKEIANELYDRVQGWDEL